MYQSSIYHTHHISMFSKSNHNIRFYIAYESQLEKGVTNPKYFSNTCKKTHLNLHAASSRSRQSKGDKFGIINPNQK